MIIMTKGLPASGKSTWALNKVAKDQQFLRINKDDSRGMLFGTAWTPKREKDVIAVRDAIVRVALERKRSVIVDDTNLHPKHEAALRKIADEFKVPFEVRFFDADVETCIERDAKRAKPVGAKVITDMYRQFLLPTPEPQDPALPPAIIVDMDGTLALMGDRNPYDDHLAGDDLPNTPVVSMVQSYLAANSEVRLIVMSGRDAGRSAQVTAEWLHRHGFAVDELLMRGAGDTRKDSIVKREMYDGEVKGRYAIQFVVDDRDQVVRMWRDDLGLPTFQVNWGNF